MYEGIDTVVLYEELAYEDVLPLSWRVAKQQVSEVYRRGLSESNAKLLQACAALEEHGPTEKADDRSPFHADLVRLDLKMNLLLDMVGQLLIANRPRPPAMPVRFNALGAVWQQTQNLPIIGSYGVLEMYLRECMFEPIRLAGQVAGVSEQGRIKVKFDNPGELVAELIEKLAFRRHRRQVAGARSGGRES